MSNWFHARTIVEEPAAERAAARFVKKFTRFDDAFEALKWLLARECETLSGPSRTVGDVEYHLYRQAADHLAGTPEITVLFTYDDNEITIIGINAEEAEAEID